MRQKIFATLGVILALTLGFLFFDRCSSPKGILLHEVGVEWTENQDITRPHYYGGDNYGDEGLYYFGTTGDAYGRSFQALIQRYDLRPTGGGWDETSIQGLINGHWVYFVPKPERQ